MTEAVITEAVTGHEHKRTELRAKGGAYWIVSTVKRRAQGDFVVGIVKERRGQVLMREGTLKVELWKCAEHAHEKGI